MADKNTIEFALRILLKNPQEAANYLREIESRVAGVGDAAKDASSSLAGVDAKALSEVAKAADAAGKSLDGIDAQALEEVGAAASAAATGLQQEAETAEQAEQRIRAMVRASLEKKAALEASADAERQQAAAGREAVEVDEERAAQLEAVNRAAYDSQAAITAQMRSIGDLQERVDLGVTSFEDLYEIEQLIDQQMQAGLLTQEEQVKLLAELDKQEKKLIATQQREQKELQALTKAYDPASAALKKLADDQARLQKALDDGVISREQFDRAMVGLDTQRAQWEQYGEGVEQVTRKMGSLKLTAREVRSSLASVASQLAQGNVAGAGNSLMSLGARGVMGGASGGAIAAGAAVAALTATVAAAALAFNQAAGEQAGYDRALATTGGYVGRTREELAEFAAQLDELPRVSTRQAAAAVAEVAATGTFFGEQFEIATRAATVWAANTGDSVDDTVAKFERIRRDPVQALLELTEKEHFLTQAQLERVRALLEEGREQEAVTYAMQVYADVVEDRAPQVHAALSPLKRMWADIKQEVGEVWDATVGFFRDERVMGGLRSFNGFLNQVGKIPIFGNVANVAGRALGYFTEDPAAPTPAAVTDGPLVDPKKDKVRQDWQREAARDIERSLNKRKQMEAEIASMKKAGEAAGVKSEEIATREAAIRKRYADEAARSGGKKKTDTQQAQEAAQRELENLTKQNELTAELGEGETKLSNEARVRYEINKGIYKLASEELQQKVLAAAVVRDQQLAEQAAERERKKALEDTTRAYERLREELRTPVEAAVANATSQIEDLNKALAAGIVDAAKYREDLSRIVGGVGPAPTLDMPWNDPTGLDSEQERLDEYAEQLRAWFDTRTQIIAEGRAKGQETEQFWRDQEFDLEQQHQDRLATLQQAQQELQLAQATSAFGSLATIAKNAAGEQSRAYQALFAISKGFAVAQASVSLGIALAKANEKGWPWSMAEMANVLAQFANITSIIASASLGYRDGGKIRGPGTGTSDSIPIWASNGEFMVRERVVSQPGALPFLDDFNERGMSAVREWGRFATGGLIAHEPARGAADPRFQQGDAAPTEAAGPLSQASFFFYTNLEQAMQAMMASPAFEKQLVEISGNNGRAIQAQWGNG